VGNGLTKADKDSRLAEIVGWLGLDGMLKRLPTELSGGQLQRVALGKTLMARPKLLLLDEPFSQLDVRLAEQMRRLLNECHARYGMTQVMVTHQPLDALCCVDKLAVLDRGKLVHFDTPDNIRQQPKTLFAAELTSPCGLNVLPSAALPGMGFDLQAKLAFRPEAVRVSDAQAVAPAQPSVPFKCRLGAIKDLGIVKLREAYVDEHKILMVCASAVSEPALGALQAIEGDQLQCWISRADLMVFAE
ncbi:MAG: ABC transporter ATP-binding protein, partial [Pirellulaceae bacterium]|nr:ABC transporter ATP-binding protein [Pirellulaceae bacterium]